MPSGDFYPSTGETYPATPSYLSQEELFRLEALRLANQQTYSRETEAVVKRAEAYYKFLKGQS
jgi:hypothetical protein